MRRISRYHVRDLDHRDTSVRELAREETDETDDSRPVRFDSKCQSESEDNRGIILRHRFLERGSGFPVTIEERENSDLIRGQLASSRLARSSKVRTWEG